MKRFSFTLSKKPSTSSFFSVLYEKSPIPTPNDLHRQNHTLMVVSCSGAENSEIEHFTPTPGPSLNFQPD